ncbi:MATE family efflux transporter [Sporanaerobium hydrogeniformans]|uniref:MATE family efflux transporter n=1 Tax=Sporanaerobium hydrogeniformans TaxID=3072179 RepID=A0AC61DE03_9FIRM|nr:MATE family efflux transporter [Sporanaerobium hydrogeniformans]PHV71409.1 MATE family efflux transporter [Sporanaerobium hydrogeniformans]
MKTPEANLSQKDQQFRVFALTGNMWRVLLHVCMPLALYQSLNQLFKILDTMMAASINAEAVSAVAYLSQINLTLSAIGGGLAVGASLKISEAYGAGNYALVKARVSSLFGLCGLLSVIILLLLPFTPSFLAFAKTPPELIAIGTSYFIVELISMVISFFNNVYIAIERARGNSKRILYLNFLAILFKLALTAYFVYFLNTGITMIAVATVLSQLLILIAALVNLREKNNAFSFSFKEITFKGPVTWPMLTLSFPVIVEKVAFSLGKVVVNSMSSHYGTLTVGALGISNNLGGITTNPQNGFQEGAAAVISQNLGAGQPKRALEAFWKLLVLNILLGIIGQFLTLNFLAPLSMLFAGSDSEFAYLIAKIYRYEALGCIPLGINAAVMALLYGFGYTKLTLLINFCRVFIFRIPVLWYLQNYTLLGSESVGVVMMISNILTGAFALVIALLVIIKLKKSLTFTPLPL